MKKFYGFVRMENLSEILRVNNVLEEKQIEVLEGIQSLSGFYGIKITELKDDYRIPHYRKGNVVLDMYTDEHGFVDELFERTKNYIDEEWEENCSIIREVTDSALDFLNSYINKSVENNLEVLGYDEEWLVSYNEYTKFGYR